MQVLSNAYDPETVVGRCENDITEAILTLHALFRDRVVAAELNRKNDGHGYACHHHGLIGHSRKYNGRGGADEEEQDEEGTVVVCLTHRTSWLEQGFALWSWVFRIK